MTKIRLNILVICLIAILAISTISIVSAADKTISPTTSGGLKKAIDTAKNGDTIYLNNGVYKGKNNREITINKNIQIVGKGNNVVFDGQGKYKFLKINKNKKVALQKITFTKGNARNNGGAIESRGTLTINSCTFTNNKAKSSGGAIYCINSGKLTVTGSTFTNNQATNIGGGAIRIVNGESSVTRSTFTNNKAKNEGGAIKSGASMGKEKLSKITVTRSTFTNNQVEFSGGAIWTNSIKFTSSDSTFKNNKATIGRDTPTGGGAISTYASESTVTRSTFTNNQANSRLGGGHGGAIGYGSELKKSTITGSTFTNNYATSKGAAIQHFFGSHNPLQITDSTFTGNTVGDSYCPPGDIIIHSYHKNKGNNIKNSIFN